MLWEETRVTVPTESLAHKRNNFYAHFEVTTAGAKLANVNASVLLTVLIVLMQPTWSGQRSFTITEEDARTLFKRVNPTKAVEPDRIGYVVEFSNPVWISWLQYSQSSLTCHAVC